jgi:cyclophilin family peptidyl-prolyl cis-trans isomerase
VSRTPATRSGPRTARPAAWAMAWLAVAALSLAGCGGAPSGGGGLVKSSEGFAQVVIETEEGDIRFEMLPEEAPATVDAMSPLILGGAYDGKTFFQRRDGAFLQFGAADAEASVLPTPVSPEVTGEPLDRGMVALAWVGDRSRTSQRLIFPLTRLDEALDNQFTVFGRVVEGMDVLDRLAEGSGVLRVRANLNRPVIRIVTQKGNIIIEMDPDRAPQTVARISDLTCQAFYNGTVFHRVEDTLIQGGDPNGDGTGGTGVKIPAEINDGRFFRAAVGMARDAGDLDSADSQFFIMKQQVRELDGRYTYFGKVVAGMAVVDAIEPQDVMLTVNLQFDLQSRDCAAGDTSTPPPDNSGFQPNPPDTNTGNTGGDTGGTIPTTVGNTTDSTAPPGTDTTP